MDNDLKKRIREVFDNYEDTGADEGWQLLREKFPEQKKRRPVAWLWLGSAAAVLLLLLGTGLWLRNKPVANTNNTHAVVKPNRNTNKTDSANYANPGQLTANKIVVADTAVLHNQHPALAINNSINNKTAIDHVNGNTEKTTRSKVNNNANNTQYDNTVVYHEPLNKAGNTVQHSSVLMAADSAKNNPLIKPGKIQPEVYALSPAVETNNQTADTTVIVKNPVKAKTQLPAKSPMDMMFANDSHVQENRKTEKQKNNDKAVRFSIYAGSYFNYAKGSNNQVNVGGGVTTDIRITHNLRLSTGVSVGQNTLTYNGQTPLVAAASAKVAAAQNLSATTYQAQGEYIKSSPSAVKNYNANLVGLDVPVNLKYLFNPEKSSAYVLAGVSSGTFVNETYNYSYNRSTSNFAVPSSTTINPSQEPTDKNSFNSFYFAKTLNVAFGIGYPLGKNQLIIEPFLKYPLDGMGSQQLKFGAGGLNLKFNISNRIK